LQELTDQFAFDDGQVAFKVFTAALRDQYHAQEGTKSDDGYRFMNESFHNGVSLMRFYKCFRRKDFV